VPERFRLQMLGLGASRIQMVAVLLREARCRCSPRSWRASAA
jgi:hypothetical protein